MSTEPNKFEIRAQFDRELIAVYAAFSPSIAEVALQNQKFLPPFSYNRMTWVKPSFLWLMYRSEWGQRAGMECILRIWISRQSWDAALCEAVLTTPERHVYKDAATWKAMSKAARIKVQWDPERDLRNNRLPLKSIQVGIAPVLAEEYAKKWIQRIDDYTPVTRKIHQYLLQENLPSAEALLPREEVYPASDKMKIALGMR